MKYEGGNQNLQMRNTIIDINLSNLEHNFKQIAKFSNNAKIIPIIKANGYGHGIIDIAKNLDSPRIAMLGVAFAEEAIQLRESGETRDIIIIVPPELQEIEEILKYNITITLGRLELLPKINEIAKQLNKIAKIHIFINTGMNRDGIIPEEMVQNTSILNKYENIEFEGICSHFATSEFADKTFMKRQLDCFDNILNLSPDFYNHFKYKHIANSAAIINCPESIYNSVRPGIALYGLMPEKELADKMDLKPIMTLKSNVKKVQKLKKGDTTGYSFHYIADKDTHIAVVPIGYGDGYSCAFSNNAECLIQGRRFPLVGSICMDQVLVDIGNSQVNIGDEVVLIGKQGKDEITVYELANKIHTIPYQIITSFLNRIPRIYRKDNV